MKFVYLQIVRAELLRLGAGEVSVKKTVKFDPSAFHNALSLL